MGGGGRRQSRRRGFLYIHPAARLFIVPDREIHGKVAHPFASLRQYRTLPSGGGRGMCLGRGGGDVVSVDQSIGKVSDKRQQILLSHRKSIAYTDTRYFKTIGFRPIPYTRYFCPTEKVSPIPIPDTLKLSD